MFWEKLNKRANLFTIIIAAVIIALFVLIWNRPMPSAGSQIGYSLDTVVARVISIAEEGQIQMGDVTQTYQVVNVMVLEGEHEQDFFTVEYGTRSILPTDTLLKENDKILVLISGLPDGSLNASFIDYVRSDAMLVLLVIFIALCIVVSRWKGIRSLLGTALSLLVILFFIIPSIIAGDDPIFVSIIGSLVFLAVSLYLVYGWTLKTHLSIASLLISLLITALLSGLFVHFARLNGSGDENAIYLLQFSNQLNIKDLLVAGIIIGTLGVMDDLIVSQVSVVIEIFRADPDMDFKQRFARAMNVGRDHIAATVNTLVLAYLGASLPLFLLISNAGTHISTLLNLSILAEEVVRTLVGTIGLFIAVPIATLLSCWAVDKPHRYDLLIRIFGPLLSPSEFSHPHPHA
jgi:uncharacterized membrane protein